MKKITSILVLIFCLTQYSCDKALTGNSLVPASPTYLTAALISSSQVDLNWTDNATNETGYKIERKIGTGNFSQVGIVGADITGYSDNTVSVGSTYTYRVVAYNTAGASLNYSNEYSITTTTPTSLPVVSTTGISSVTYTTAVSGGSISSDGGSTIIARGIVWSTSSSPTVLLSTKTTDGTGVGSFTSSLTSLSANTTYYIRAYATNANGTAYGDLVNFTTLNIDVTSGLIGYWLFNGNANDASGNGNNLSNNGATLTFDRFSVANSAYSYTGQSGNGVTGTYMTIPNFGINNMASFSINIWVYESSVLGDGEAYISFGDTYPGGAIRIFRQGYSLTTNAGLLCFDYGSNNPTNTIYAGTGFQNQWVMCTMTKSNNVLKAYINGSLIGTINNLSPVSISNTGNYLARHTWGTGTLQTSTRFNGKIDDVRIYNRALTQEQITYLYQH